MFTPLQFTRAVETMDWTKLKIVALGDSITWGYPNGRSWTNLVSIETGIQIVNRGVSGETLEEMYYRLENDVIREKPEICIIMGGTNDVFFGNTPEEMMNMIEQMAGELKRRKITPVIGLPIPLTRGGQTEEKLQALRRKLQDSGMLTIDFASDFARSKKDFKKLLPDGIHPADEGKRLMAERLKKELPRIVSAYVESKLEAEISN
ncbi:MAG: GDSL-type esterase/lipase family protein [Turneriella sp.]